MEGSLSGVCETYVLLVFLFLTRITEQYLDMVTTEEQEVSGEEAVGWWGWGTGFPIISDMMEAPGSNTGSG